MVFNVEGVQAERHLQMVLQSGDGTGRVRGWQTPRKQSQKDFIEDGVIGREEKSRAVSACGAGGFF